MNAFQGATPSRNDGQGKKIARSRGIGFDYEFKVIVPVSVRVRTS